MLDLNQKRMNSDFLHSSSLKTSSIEQVNDALIVLRHFIELNEKLLPILLTLSEKKAKTDKDFDDIRKIREVYESYHFDIKSSQILMNSSILSYIQGAYQAIIDNSECLHTQVKFMLFEKELIKLKKNWTMVGQN
jgi:hypothetical protein